MARRRGRYRRRCRRRIGLARFQSPARSLRCEWVGLRRPARRPRAQRPAKAAHPLEVPPWRPHEETAVWWDSNISDREAPARPGGADQDSSQPQLGNHPASTRSTRCQPQARFPWCAPEPVRTPRAARWLSVSVSSTASRSPASMPLHSGLRGRTRIAQSWKCSMCLAGSNR